MHSPTTTPHPADARQPERHKTRRDPGYVPPRRSVMTLALLGTLSLLAGCSAGESDSAGRSGAGQSYSSAEYGSPTTGAPNFDPAEETLTPDQAPGFTNPFVMTAHDPMSTFAADVDTASYDLFRRDVNAGQLPDQSSVRLEEYVNYFHYDYAVPGEDAPHPFNIDLEAAHNPLGRDTVLLRVGIQAADPLALKQDRGPANIVFLVDVSGSMQSAEKLPLVQRVMRNTVEALGEDDRVSIVTYAGGTGVHLPSTPAQEYNRIIAAIDELSAGGSTNGSAGIDLAYEQASLGMVEGINHVVLMTDGDFNVGPSSDEALVMLIEKKRETGITLTALGFGAGYLNDSMMEKVSNAGNGVYGVITDSAQADRYVAKRMFATLVHVAKDVKLQVEFNPVHVHAYRLLGYENRAIADDDFRVDTVDAGEVGSGHQVTALYELVTVGQMIPTASDGAGAAIDDGADFDGVREVAAADMVKVKVRYKHPGASASDPAAEMMRTLRPGDVSLRAIDTSLDAQWAFAVAGIAELVGGSPYASMDELPSMRAIIRAQANDDDERSEFSALLSLATPML